VAEPGRAGAVHSVGGIYEEGLEMGRKAAQGPLRRQRRSRAAPSALGTALWAPEALQPPTIPGSIHAAVELSDHIARLGVERVAVVLGVRMVDLASMLAGRVEPPEVGMRRLRATSG
jgi:hypothetical protein